MRLRTPESGFLGALGFGLLLALLIFCYSVASVVVFLWEWMWNQGQDWPEVCSEFRERWKAKREN